MNLFGGYNGLLVKIYKNTGMCSVAEKFIKPFKLCTFSRVMKEKGIEDAVNAVKEINASFGRIVYTLDIYGQVDEKQVEWFNNLQKEFPDYIKYCGVVAFDKSTEVLKNYFALLFPTYYDGQGFAGTIIDAFAAGLPVIASDWKYNSEIVENGKTGLIYSLEDKKQLVKRLMWCIDYKNNLFEMKMNCIKESINYLPNKVVVELLRELS